MDTAAVADGIEARLRAAGTPERAAHERTSLKSDLTFLGASVPAIRTAARAAFRDLPEPTHDVLVDLVTTLWARPVHERRMAAVELLDLGSGLLTTADLPLLETLLRESRTWALVDGLSVSVVGALADRDPAGVDATLRRWAGDEDHWVRRASLLAHLPGLRRGDGDFERFSELADGMLEEREFFVRKAIGWVLRETGKRRPGLVTSWLRPRAHRAAGVTVREAVKYLPADDQAAIEAARRG